MQYVILIAMLGAVALPGARAATTQRSPALDSPCYTKTPEECVKMMTLEQKIGQASAFVHRRGEAPS